MGSPPPIVLSTKYKVNKRIGKRQLIVSQGLSLSVETFAQRQRESVWGGEIESISYL